jgi:hypothetical protein
MAFAGIFQPFERLRWIRFGLLMRDGKISRRFSVPQTMVPALLAFANRKITSVACSAFLAITVPSEDSNIDREKLAASNVRIRFHSPSLALDCFKQSSSQLRCLGAGVEGALAFAPSRFSPTLSRPFPPLSLAQHTALAFENQLMQRRKERVIAIGAVEDVVSISSARH